MSNLYYRSDEVFLYVQFDINDVNSIINNPRVRVLHDVKGVIKEDLPWTNMSQMSENEFFYNYKIPSNADLGQYQIIYLGEINQKEAYVMETLHVINKSETFINAIKLYGYIQDIKTNCALADSKIIITDNASNEIVSQSLTNEDGYWEAFVYPGDYKFTFSKVGFVSIDVIAQIGDESNEMQFNNIGLESEKSKLKGDGIYSIGDKYVLKNGQPLVGLNIQIFNVNNPVPPAIAQDITNEDGVWECFLNSGTYLLKITGEKVLGKSFNKTFRLKVDNSGNATFEDLSKNVAISTDTEYIGPGEGSKTVSDKILDRNGNPIIDVQVNVFRPNDMNNIIAQTYSDEQGYWELFLDPGKYTIEYYHPKFKTITENREVK